MFAFCKKDSFTLIELLVVVVVLSVLVGLAVPNFSSAFANVQLSDTANAISDLMRYAQGRAVVNRRELRLIFEDGYYRLQESSAQDDEQDDENSEENFVNIEGRMGRRFAVPQDITIESSSLSIKFYPDGTIEKARIYVSNKRGKYFTVSTEGRMGYVDTLDSKLSP